MRKLLFLLGLSLLLWGCKLFDEDNTLECITITLPDWPPDSQADPGTYPPLSRWKITLAGKDGVKCFFTTDSRVEVETVKNCPLSLQAQPVTLLQNGSDCLYFHPAGFIYPGACSPQSARWSLGYPALLMQKLYESCQLNGASPSQAALYVSSFNWAKACELIENKISESGGQNTKFYNPWLCDTARIIKNLNNESFRASLLSPTSCYAYSTSELFLLTGLSVLSPFIPENSNIRQNHQITVKKDSPLLLSDLKEFGIFLNYKSAKNVLIEYIYIPIYKGEL